MRLGDIGDPVRGLQKLLKINDDGWFGPATQAAVIAAQARAGLVQDGIAGPKTLAVLGGLSGTAAALLLTQRDIDLAADRLGVPAASLMAVNHVESRGEGFLQPGLPIILFERHVMYRQLNEAGRDAAALAAIYPALINPERGGYRQPRQEWYRMGLAREIDATCANNSASWGAFQLMGYHWPRLGYASQGDFIAAMAGSEAGQLDAFVRFIESDPAIHKAIKARKWADFARLYNGPDYKENLYDIKLQRAYERFSTLLPTTPSAAPAPAA